MKNILIMFAVLAMASSVASAGLLISVNGVTDPAAREVTLYPSDTAVIDIHAVDQTESIAAWMLIQGPGGIDASAPTNLFQDSAAKNMDPAELPGTIADLKEFFGYDGVVDIIEMDVKDISDPIDPIPQGKVIDGLLFHCIGEGDVILTLLDGLDFSVLDSLTIHQIPEPITFALLGLGGLFLRRRK